MKSAEFINRVDVPLTPSPITPLWITASAEEKIDNLNFRYHSHTFFEIHFIKRGNMVYGFSDGEVLVPEGSFLIIPPSRLHRVSECSEHFLKITVASTVSDSSVLFESLSCVQCIAYPMSHGLLANLDAIEDNAITRPDFCSEIVRARIVESVYLAASLAGVAEVYDEQQKSFDSRVFRAKRYIQDNPQIFFGCEEIAAFCRLSPKQLGRLFREHEGVTLLDYLHRCKIEDAKRMLADRDMPIDRVAESLGFSNSQYFCRFFKGHTGKTPSEYREENVNS